LKKSEGGVLPRPRVGANCSMGRLHHNNGQDEPGVAVEYQRSHPKDLTRFARNVSFFVNRCFGGA